MNEHATHPRSARRHPRALIGQVQIYAQNNPRAYGVRVSLLGFPLAMAPPLIICAILVDDWTLLLPLLAGAAVAAGIMCVVLALVMPRFVRRTLGTSTLPPDTGPVDLLEAKRQLRRGGLHENEEVNRIARVVAAQAEAKINSPKTINVLSLLGALTFGLLAALTYLSSGPSFDFWFRTSFGLLFVAYLLFLGPWVKRYRQRARDFAKLYDNHRVAHQQEAHLRGD